MSDHFECTTEMLRLEKQLALAREGLEKIANSIDRGDATKLAQQTMAKLAETNK